MFHFKSNKVLKLICLLLITSNLWLILKNIDRNNQNNYSKITLDDPKLLKVEEIDLKKELDILDLAEQHTNVALNYYNEWKNYSNCEEWSDEGLVVCNTEVPSIERIAFNNIYWQTIPINNKTQYFLYNAYYDNRGYNKYVRIVGHRIYPIESELRLE